MTGSRTTQFLPRLQSARASAWRYAMAITCAAAAMLAASSGGAQELCPTAAHHGQDCFVTTKHEVTVHGTVLHYTARAGLLPIRDNATGEVHGRMYYTAYTLDRAAGQPPRPVAFVFNGGPGANSELVHLVAFGPKRIVVGKSGPVLEDNQETWLDQADLVFIDPIGTGFSRPAKREYGKEFYNTLGDFASVTEFIREYQTEFHNWDAPLVIAGESFGGWRAAGVTEALEEDGHRVAGVIEISGGVGFGAVLSHDEITAFYVPSRTAAAFYHKKLAPDLQADLQATLAKSEAWAKNEYLPALERLDSLTDSEREAIVTQLARFTGISASRIDRSTLAVSRTQFVKGLLRDQHLELGRFDTRMTGPDPADAARAPLVNRYLRDNLKFDTDLTYQGLGDDGYTPLHERKLTPGGGWLYNTLDSGTYGGVGAPRRELDSPPGVQPWLPKALKIDPSIQILAVAGLYDSLNSCFGNTMLVSHIKPEFRDNVTLGCYGGGHMIYIDPDARLKLRADVKTFLQKIAAR